jgi:dipeptidase D
MRVYITVASLLLALCQTVGAAPSPGPAARKAADHAVKAYGGAVIESLAAMVSFNTVADKEVPFERNPQHLGFKKYLKEHAARLGLDYADHGYVIVIGHGHSSERVGIITHGDIQPVDPAKWNKSPFELDRTSEPGRLIGRGTEDDKGPIATAMYAMKAIKDNKLALSKRIELYVYMAEESDWAPLAAFLKTHKAPQINITIDAEYPVVTAEKGWGTVSVTMPAAVPASAAAAETGPFIGAFSGGFFNSQIPEDASVLVERATPEIEARIKARAAGHKGMRYTYSWQGQQLQIAARGVSAHSSKPQDGVNAISMLADALKVGEWPNNSAGALVNFLNDMIGTGIHGQQFGAIAYSDDFMGPMTFAPTLIKQSGNGLQLNINMRRPRGKERALLESQVRAALDAWQAKRVVLADVTVQISDPWIQEDAPQVPTLLSVFSYYTGITNPQPIAVGGGTNSRLFPHAVSFGPTMPGTVYSGHSEHEFITTKQLLMNLKMYTAVMVELAK